MAQQSTENNKIYRFFVDDKEYQSTKQVITGEELRTIAGIIPNVRIFLKHHSRDHADRQITNGSSIDLAELVTEKFYTLAAPTLDIY